MATFSEYRHQPSADRLWQERWHFEVVAPDVSWAMYSQLALCPNLGVAWWWTAIARRNQALLLVRDQTLALPRPPGFEVRGSGLWADLTCHEPMQRWQVNFEGIAVALEDPEDAFRGERGDRVAIEFEFEWEFDGSEPYAIDDGYEQRCVAHGEAHLGVGGEHLTVDEPLPGRRQHTWGVHDWWSASDAPPELPVDEVLLDAGLVVEGPDGAVAHLRRVATGDGWVEWRSATQS